MAKPPELIALEERLDAAEQEEREAWRPMMPKRILVGQAAAIAQPTDDELERWEKARALRDDLRLQHKALIDRLFE